MAVLGVNVNVLLFTMGSRLPTVAVIFPSALEIDIAEILETALNDTPKLLRTSLIVGQLGQAPSSR